MNSCFEPCNRAVCGVYADKVNPVTGQRNMANCCLGLTCSAANVPEVFRNCANIAITGGVNQAPPPPRTTSCRLAVAGGACGTNGGGACCSNGQCEYLYLSCEQVRGEMHPWC